jgi:GT2 family glycosyltransferase
MPRDPIVSIIIPSFNRMGDLDLTLSELAQDPYPAKEVIVVDNGSTDGTLECIRGKYPETVILALPGNLGAEARNRGLDMAQGEFTLMIDSDSHPEPGAIGRMVAHFREDPKLGAAAFRAEMSNSPGKDETGGRFNVFVGCGCGFRTDLLRAIGGYPAGYHFYVEEYDVSYRVMNAGFLVRYFADLLVHHRRSMSARDEGRILHYLVRNNMYLNFRYWPVVEAFRDLRWTLFRYHRVCVDKGVGRSFWTGFTRGIWRALFGIAMPALSPATLDQAMPHRFSERRFREIMKSENVKSIALWGIGKDFEPIVRGAGNAGASIVGAFPTPSQHYFAQEKEIAGVRILDIANMKDLACDALVICTCSPGEAFNEKNFLAGQAISVKVIPLFEYGFAEG